MTINTKALDLIKSSEGFVNHWYPDPASGGKPYTCNFGHTDAVGEPYYKDNPHRQFSLEEGTAILIKDLKLVEAVVNKYVTVPLNENQYGAINSFVYNLGETNFRNSTLLKKLNLKDYVGASNEFPKWVKAAGKTMPGLVIRRQKEKELFNSIVDTNINIPVDVVTNPNPTNSLYEMIARLIANLFK